MSDPERSPIDRAIDAVYVVLDIHMATKYPDDLAEARGRWMARLVVNSLPQLELENPVGDEFRDTTRFEDLSKEYAKAVGDTATEKVVQDSEQPPEEVAADVIRQEHAVRWDSGIYPLIRRAQGGVPVEPTEPQMDDFLRATAWDVVDARSREEDPQKTVIPVQVEREVKHQLAIDNHRLNGKKRK